MFGLNNFATAGIYFLQIAGEQRQLKSRYLRLVDRGCYGRNNHEIL
jgi:hypothetical protein